MRHLSNLTRPMPAMSAVETDAWFQKLGRAMTTLTSAVNFADLIRNTVSGEKD